MSASARTSNTAKGDVETEGLLALELGGRCGFALWRPGSNPLLGSNVLPGEAADLGQALAVFADWLELILTTNRPLRVVYQAPWSGEGSGGRANPETLRRLICLAGVAALVCHREAVPASEANVQAVRRHLLGNGRPPSKAAQTALQARAQSLGLEPRNAAERDAFALLDYAAAHRGLSLKASVKARAAP